MSLVENAVTEFKREYTSDIVKTVIAYANTGGGTLYIDIDNDGSAFGVANVEETRSLNQKLILAYAFHNHDCWTFCETHQKTEKRF